MRYKIESNNQNKHSHKHKQQNGGYQRKVRWREDEENKGGQIMVMKETRLWLVSTKFDLQIVYYRIVHLKCI